MSPFCQRYCHNEWPSKAEQPTIESSQFCLSSSRKLLVLPCFAAVHTSKTAAAAAAEFLVVRDNLDALLDGAVKEQSRYDGYSSCPLVTKKG